MAKVIKVAVDVDADRKGVFEVKTSLPYREVFREGELKRGILGRDPGNASPAEQFNASMIAFLATHVVGDTSPVWWKIIDGGLDMDEDDDVVLTKVYEQVVTEINRVKGEAKADAEKKAKDLRKDAADQPA